MNSRDPEANSDDLSAGHGGNAFWYRAAPCLVFGDVLEFEMTVPADCDRAVITCRSPDDITLFEQSRGPGRGIIRMEGLSVARNGCGILRFETLRGGLKTGYIERGVCFLANLTDELGSVRWKETALKNPREVFARMALISAMEALKCAASAGSREAFDAAYNELECRHAALRGQPLPEDVPPEFKFIELSRGMEDAVSVEFPRGPYRQCVAISVRCGSIPIAEADVNLLPDKNEAERYFKAASRYMRITEKPRIAGADEAVAGYGRSFTGALNRDAMPEREAFLLSPEMTPHSMPPEDAADLALDAVTVFPDAPDGMAEAVRNVASVTGLPEIPCGEAGSRGLVLAAGLPRETSDPYYWRASGEMGGQLIFRRGCFVFETSWTNPSLDLVFARFILEGKPLSPQKAELFRRGRSKQLFAAGLWRDIKRTGADSLFVGDVHSHTIYSDGHVSPAGLMASAFCAGLDFVIVSDHNRLDGALELMRVMKRNSCSYAAWPGLEITMNEKYHLNIYPLAVRIDNNMPYWDIVDSAHDAGAVVQLNHPMSFGTSLKHFWYGDFGASGLDAAENNLENYRKWQSERRSFTMTGGTDSHIGIFGFGSHTVILSDKLSGEALADAVRNGRAGLVNPRFPDYIYGRADLREEVASWLAGPDLLKARFIERTADSLENFNAKGFLLDSKAETGMEPWTNTVDPAANSPEIIPGRG